jgi:hypothetical protein
VCCETREVLKGNNYERWHCFAERAPGMSTGV